eukprot:SAG22_NODE_415_length_10814_cov_10.762109_4_plen_601_part_00
MPGSGTPQPPKTLQRLSQEELLQLSEQTGTLLLLDVPEGTIVGLDFTSYTVGPSFRGIKLIPPGLHLVHHCARDNKTGETSAIKGGFFVWIEPRAVECRRWVPEDEDFAELPAGEAEQAAAAAAKQHDRYTGPYPYDTLRDWQRLVSKLGPASLAAHGVVLGRPIWVPDDAVVGVGGARAEDQEEILRADPRLRRSAAEAGGGGGGGGGGRGGGGFAGGGAGVRFRTLPARPVERVQLFRAMLSAAAAAPTAAEVSRLADDPSPLLARMLAADSSRSRSRSRGGKAASSSGAEAAAGGGGAPRAQAHPGSGQGAGDSADDGDRLLAELQLAFLLFALLGSWPAFEQWKRIVVLLCAADAAITTACDGNDAGGGREDRASAAAAGTLVTLYRGFVESLLIQLAHGPPELLEDELAEAVLPAFASMSGSAGVGGGGGGGDRRGGGEQSNFLAAALGSFLDSAEAAGKQQHARRRAARDGAAREPPTAASEATSMAADGGGSDDDGAGPPPLEEEPAAASASSAGDGSDGGRGGGGGGGGSNGAGLLSAASRLERFLTSKFEWRRPPPPSPLAGFGLADFAPALAAVRGPGLQLGTFAPSHVI